MIVDLNKEPTLEENLTTRATTANAVALARSVMKRLIGKEIGTTERIDLDSVLSTCVSLELENKLQRG